MKNKVLLRLKSLTLWHEYSPGKDVYDTIEKTLLGNPGGMRYQLLDTPKKLKETPNTNFFTMRKRDNLYCVMALMERITRFKQNLYNTCYVRYVTFNQQLSTKKTAADKQQRMQRLGQSFIKEGMRQHAENYPFQFDNPEIHPEKKLYYAYVEKSNKRSLDFTNFFFQKIGEFEVKMYSNLYPNIQKGFEKLSPKDLPKVKALFKQSYNQHAFFFIDDNNLLEHCFVIKEGEEIVAATKARISNWRLEEVPGIAGKMLTHVLPYMPAFSRVIKKNRFSFVTFDTLYCKPGFDNYISKLFESVCTYFKIYTGMIYLDKDEEIAQRIGELNNLGFFNKIYTDAGGDILARFVKFTDKEKQEFIDNPTYVSGYDLT